MKLITLNTHSLEEEHYQEKLEQFVEGICREMPHVIALQEVNQTRTKAPVAVDLLERSGYLPCELGDDCEEAVIREDNHGYRAAKMLLERGVSYSWTWVSAKIGYERYDEGLALFCRFPVLDTGQFFITKTHDYRNWKTRKILGITAMTDRGPQQFYSVHMGWWQDEEEPFYEQWKRIAGLVKPQEGAPSWLMGDFNSPSHIPGEGYDLIKKSGWQDSYELAEEKDGGYTVDHSIDGWKDKKEKRAMSIDYIWADRRMPVKCSRVLFDGKCYPVVSDHFGISAECGSGKEVSADSGMRENLHGNEE